MSLNPSFFLSSVSALKNVHLLPLPAGVGAGGKLFCKHEKELSCAAASRD